MSRRRYIAGTLKAAAGGLAAIVVLLAVQPADAADPPIDRDRAAVSRALALRYWNDSGLDKLPASYDRARFNNAINGEDDPYNVLASIAVATLSANPGHEETALKYLNESLIPFATSHKSQYVCLVSEVFYNSQQSTDELKGFAAAKHANGAVPIAFIEYAYFLIKTEPEREHLGLQMPGDNGIPEAVAAFKKTLDPKGGTLIPETAVRLDCDHQ
ncbi:MAG TPA: hypothetical protein VHA35_20430 [Dongiaceae bacterium]|nr:hypothetical protein [Dongiaceae bacterium]